MNTKILLVITLLAAPQFLRAGLQPVSVAETGVNPPAGGSSDSVAPVISADGRYVAFASLANDLVIGSNGISLPNFNSPRVNVFLRDRTNQTTTLVSIDSSGADGGNGDSYPTAISTNGQFVLFESSASNLVAGDTNGVGDVFLRDVVNGTTTLISVNSSGGPANGVSRSSVMTPDGRYVAFVSAANNLVAGDSNGIPDVFVRDTQASTTTLVSVGAQASNFTSTCEMPAISTNGRYVAFYATATNLVAGVTNTGQIFLRDLTSATTAWISSNAISILETNEQISNALCCNFTMSDNGQYIACEAEPLGSNGYATSLTGGIILRYNVVNQLTDVINTNALGIIAGFELNTRTIDMTPDGNFVAFVANLEPVLNFFAKLVCTMYLHPGNKLGMNERRAKYPSDVSDEEWAFCVSYLTLMTEVAPQRVYPLREIFNGLRYLVKMGGVWRMMPHDLPPWNLVYQQTQRWIKAGCFEAMAHDLRAILRLALERKADPSAVILDSRTLQSTPESGARAGFDGHKKRKGSKVHAAVDTLGHLLAVTVTPANEQDRAQVGQMAQAVQAVVEEPVQIAFVDQGYTGERPAAAAAQEGIRLEVVKHHEAKRGFVLLPRRWVVERSFAWAARFRRLARDYERLPATLAAFHWLAFATLMLASLFPKS